MCYLVLDAKLTKMTLIERFKCQCRRVMKFIKTINIPKNPILNILAHGLGSKPKTRRIKTGYSLNSFIEALVGA